MTIAELTIYICFFRHIYKNDNSKSLLKALGPKIIKSRNKKNALTFFSQFCSFIFQVSFMLLMLLASFNTPNKSHAYILATILKKVAFAAMTVIEVVTSRRNLNAMKLWSQSTKTTWTISFMLLFLYICYDYYINDYYIFWKIVIRCE